MALSEGTESSLKEAEGNLRNALYWASKNEKPYVCMMISDIISKVDTLIQMDKFSDKLEEKLKSGNKDFFGGFF
jgi:hypothetical protein